MRKAPNVTCSRQTAAMSGRLLPCQPPTVVMRGWKWNGSIGRAIVYQASSVGIVSHDKLACRCVFATSAVGESAGGLLHVARVFAGYHVPELYEKVFPGRSKHVRQGALSGMVCVIIYYMPCAVQTKLAQILAVAAARPSTTRVRA